MDRVSSIAPPIVIRAATNIPTRFSMVILRLPLRSSREVHSSCPEGLSARSFLRSSGPGTQNHPSQPCSPTFQFLNSTLYCGPSVTSLDVMTYLHGWGSTAASLCMRSPVTLAVRLPRSAGKSNAMAGPTDIGRQHRIRRLGDRALRPKPRKLAFYPVLSRHSISDFDPAACRN